MRARAFLPIVAAVALSGCAALALSPKSLTDQWGGPHVSLLFEGGLGTIDYDCASGTIDSLLIPAPDGSFTATGTHRPGQVGPVRVGQIFTSLRAAYSGTVKKDKVTKKNQMTLSVRLEDGTTIGPFSLTLGSQGQLTRCL